MLWPYAPKYFVEQLNLIKVDDYGITPMQNFSETTTDKTFKNNHISIYLIYVLDARLQGNIPGILKC